MAELLIRVVDRGGVDAPKGYGDSKAGDVISICPDGWVWSLDERTNQRWRIIRVGLTEIECAALLKVGDGDPMLQPCWKRKYGISFVELPTALRNQLLATRIVPIIDLTSKVAQVRTAVILKVLRT